MGKRGRPRKYGLQPPWVLERTAIVVHAFNKARKKGEKYEAAIQAAIDAFKARYLELRIGPRRVKGILAAWQPKGLPMALIVSRCPATELRSPEMRWKRDMLYSLGWPKGKKIAVYDLGLGPRPEYARTNARQ